MIGPDLHGGGHPWHGLCQAGSLTLPNADVVAYPQPTGGSCFALSVPGHTAPARSVAEQASDTALGYQWLGYALLSGDASHASGLQVYGQPLGQLCWIWAVSAGEKWLVDASGLTVAGGVLSGNLLLTAFGVHDPDGAPATTRTIAVSAAAGTNSAVKLNLLDFDESGSKAIIGLYAYADGTHEAQPMKPLPAAAVQVALAADYTAAVTEVYAASEFSTVLRVGAAFDAGAAVHFRAANSPVTGGLRVFIEQLPAAVTGAYIDVLSSYASTNTTPSDTTEYVAPASSTARLAGSDTCPEGGAFVYDYTANTPTLADAYAQAQALLAARQAEIEAQYTNIYADCGGPPDAPLLANAIWTGGVNTFDADFSWEIVFSEHTASSGGDTYKYASYTVWETHTEYTLTEDGGTGCYTGIASTSGPNTLEQGISDTVYYFRKRTTGATGAIRYEYWTTAPACSNPQYLDAPDLGTPGGTPTYTYDIAATFSAVIGGATTVLGSQAFTYYTNVQGNFSDLSLQATVLNDPDVGNADRIEVYYYHSLASGNPTEREAAACEIVFPNPCAGAYGMALINRLGGTPQPNNLYKIIKRDNSADNWSGWGAVDPQSVYMSLHPVTLDVQQSTDTPICYV